LRREENDLRAKPLLKRVMQKWLPAGDAVLEMIVMHLPSPAQAQRYRTELIYEGPAEDECATSMRACNKDGPLMMYISKMVPTSDSGRFYAFGRVFSGTVSTGQRVRILGPNYEPGKKQDLWVKNIQRTIIMMGRSVEQVPSIPAGNTCGLVGVDAYLIKGGTITDNESAHSIKQMKFSVSPVVRQAVSVRNNADLPKLVEGLKRLAKSDPLVVIETDEETGENIVAGAGELHLEICMKDLQEDFMQGAPLNISDPVVSYRETVTEHSPEGEDIMCKSANKHNRLHVESFPMVPELQTAIIDEKVVPAPKDAKAQGRMVIETYEGCGFTDPEECSGKRLWGFGPDGRGPNWIVDGTRAVQYLNEIKESVNSGFQWATKNGPLCEEEVRGLIVRLLDATLHTDSIHRGMGQILPVARRVTHAAMYLATPTLLEPMYLAEITVPMAEVGACYTVIAMRRGNVVEETPREGTPIMNLRAHLPVADSFGFTQNLRAETGGKAFPQCTFSHWSQMTGDPFNEGNRVYDVVRGVRARKGLTEHPQPLESLRDRL
jgi:elongation factor 2